MFRTLLLSLPHVGAILLAAVVACQAGCKNHPERVMSAGAARGSPADTWPWSWDTVQPLNYGSNASGWDNAAVSVCARVAVLADGLLACSMMCCVAPFASTPRCFDAMSCHATAASLNTPKHHREMYHSGLIQFRCARLCGGWHSSWCLSVLGDALSLLTATLGIHLQHTPLLPPGLALVGAGAEAEITVQDVVHGWARWCPPRSVVSSPFSRRMPMTS